MSSSTSNSDLRGRWSHLPDEQYGSELRSAQLFRETWIVDKLCLLSPLLFVASMPVFSCLLLPFLFLKPMTAEGLTWSNLFETKTLILAGAVAAFPWIWKGALRLQHNSSQWQFPMAALLAIAAIGIGPIAIELPRIRWFFVEWAKIRTPNPSFARNTLYWESRDFEQLGPQKRIATRPPKAIFVGSSQTYQSTDLALISHEAPEVVWEKNCLAGFGPMQYPWLYDRIAERQPDIVICWLSEFDFYREDTLPTSRLRWASSLTSCNRLLSELNWQLKWSTRGELADLYLGAVSPIWRHRDHIRRTALNYWRNVSLPKTPAGPEVVLAESGDLEATRENLKLNVKRARFVDFNFKSFALFSQLLNQAGIDLIVFEGQTHPEAVTAYDPAYRLETRNRLRDLAAQHRFTYYDESQIPHFFSSDFADGYHLNTAGRETWSLFVSSAVREHLARNNQSHPTISGAAH